MSLLDRFFSFRSFHLHLFLTGTLLFILGTSLLQWHFASSFLIMAWMLFLIAWMFTLGKKLNLILPNGFKMPWNIFWINNLILVPLIIAAGIGGFSPLLTYAIIFLVVFGLGFNIQFISKSLVAIEQQRAVDYFDYKFTFFRCCIFFPFTLPAFQQRILKALNNK